MSIFVWRVWRVQITNSAIDDSPKYRIQGLYGQVWSPQKTLHAHCDKSPGEYYFNFDTLDAVRYTHDNDGVVPASQCICGIYGFNQKYPPIDISFGQVLGVAEIWGKIIVAEIGYRAEYALLRALVVDAPYPVDHAVNLPLIAEKYKVPLLPSIEYAQKEFFA